MNKEIENLAVQFIHKINNKYKIKFAYLFGSFAYGKENNNSDLDLAIFFQESYSEFDDLLIRGEIIEEGKAFFNKDVDIVSLEKASTLLRYEVVKQGIVLKDHEDRAEFESLSLREYFDFQYYSNIYNKAIVDSIKKGSYFGG